ncbi:MAG: DUF2172 domain-containing protein [Helicobacteraceae bacterium]|nr:DUF2172 domain-containing protein [Helicobacteraceae bacterium]
MKIYRAIELFLSWKITCTIVNYSALINEIVSRKELLQIAYTDRNDEDAISYITSYYQERYGFYMSQRQKTVLDQDMYHIFNRQHAGRWFSYLWRVHYPFYGRVR